MTDYSELKRLAEAATKSRWATDGDREVMSAESDQLNGGYVIAQCQGPDKHENAKFIAAANPAAVLALLAEVERLREERDSQQRLCIAEMEKVAQLKAENEALRKDGGLAVQVCKLGSYGSAYDGPRDHRAFTYAEKPNNQLAWKLGIALADAHKAGGGDYIDYGLGLLKTLEQEGFGVYRIDAAMSKRVGQ